MKKSHVLVALTLLLALSIPAMAQEDEEDEKWRNFEVGITAGMNFPSGSFGDWGDSLGAKNGFTAGVCGGYCLTNAISLGAYFTYSYHGMEIYNLSYKLYDAGAYAKFALVGESDWEPYAKISGGAVFPKFATWVTEDRNTMRELSYDPALSLGLFAGLLWYTSDYGGLFLEAGYHLNMTEEVEGEYASEKILLKDNVEYISVKIGISVFFGPEE
ncbi:MAG: outer membrane beta-barrel protein [Candidatus Zixiibacteriota bacterium]|nr:MAG: outer membrane beta-barrel protein [candidate division Zixibacteria bacterium]